MKKTLHFKALALLLCLMLVLTLIPATASAAAIFGVLEIPVYKTVTAENGANPGEATFEFELSDFFADDSGITVVGNTVETDGEGTFNDTIKLAIATESDFYNLTEGFKVTEKNGGEEGQIHIGSRGVSPGGPALGPDPTVITVQYRQQPERADGDALLDIDGPQALRGGRDLPQLGNPQDHDEGAEDDKIPDESSVGEGDRGKQEYQQTEDDHTHADHHVRESLRLRQRQQLRLGSQIDLRHNAQVIEVPPGELDGDPPLGQLALQRDHVPHGDGALAVVFQVPVHDLPVDPDRHIGGKALKRQVRAVFQSPGQQIQQ